LIVRSDQSPGEKGGVISIQDVLVVVSVALSVREHATAFW
jgi:hypothetical protein